MSWPGVQAAEETARRQVRGYQELIEQADSIRRGAEELAEARLRLETLEKARAQADLLEREHGGLRRDIDVKRVRLESELQGLQTRAETSLAPKAQGRAAIEAELSSVQSGSAALEEQAREIDFGRQEMVALASEIGQLDSFLARCKEEGLELRNKLRLLREPSGGDAVCPLCQTPLSEDGCSRLADDYEVQIQAKLAEHKEAAKQLEQLKRQGSELETDLPRREAALTKAQHQRQRRITELEAGIGDARTAQRELDESTARMKELKGQMDSGAFALEESRRLGELDGLLRELAYDDLARQRFYQQTQLLAGFESRQQSLVQAGEAFARRTGEPGANAPDVARAARGNRPARRGNRRRREGPGRPARPGVPVDRGGTAGAGSRTRKAAGHITAGVFAGAG